MKTIKQRAKSVSEKYPTKEEQKTAYEGYMAANAQFATDAGGGKPTPPLWYDEMSLTNYLQNKHYHKDIIIELVKDFADSLQQAFKKGWEKGYNDIQNNGTWDYVYYRPENTTAPSTHSSSEMVEGWISVKDRLPDHKPSNHVISTSQKVRIYDKTHGEDVAWLKVFIKDSSDRLSPEQVAGYWIFENTNMKYTTVTHWQPLGKPPIN